MSTLRSFEVYLTEPQWDIITGALNSIVKKAEGKIKTCKNHPSATISSAETIDKYRLIIADIGVIQEKITEAYL